MKHRLIKLEWEDSRQAQLEWQFLKDFKSEGLVKCYTVGYFIKEEKGCKVLCQNIVDDNTDIQISGVMHIPISCITKETELEEVEDDLIEDTEC